MKHFKLKALPALLLAASLQAQAQTQLPTNMSVVSGQASAQTNGKQLTVTSSANTILDWRSFSIGADSAVRFNQPSSGSSVLNRVSGNDPSSILGSLSSNGQVWLLNPNGVLFGTHARVDVAGLVTSTLNIANDGWLAGRHVFSGTGGGIVNQGEIRSSTGGRVALIASSVSNEGLIAAPGGQIVLAAGASVELVDTGAPNLAVKVSAPTGQAMNLGTLSAGRVDVMAAAVNQQGIVEAQDIVLQADGRLTLAVGSRTSADGAQGGTVKLLGREIELQDGANVSASGAQGGGTVLVGGGAQGRDASVPNADGVYFAPGASISADAIAQGDGGHIVLWGNVATRAYGSLSACGGAQGGRGGLIETSGHWLDARPTHLDVSAPFGAAGTWLLDPYDITISDAVGDAGYNVATFTATANSATMASATIASALQQGTNVTVSTGAGGGQAGNITVAGATISPSLSSTAALTLNAAGDIVINNSTMSTASLGSLNVNLNAGGSGQGGIVLSSANISTGGGNIALTGSGHAGTPDGVKMTSTTLSAGAGNVNISGTTSVAGGRGVALDVAGSANNVYGNSILIKGTSSAGTGVLIGSVNISSGLSATLSGTGGINGLELDFNGGNSALSLSTSSGLVLTGSSTGTGYGVLVNAPGTANNVLSVGSGTVQINGANNAGGSQAVALLGSSSGSMVNVGTGGLALNATGGGMLLQNVSMMGETATFDARSDSSLVINGGYLWSSNQLGLHAQNITLQGALTLSAGAASGTGIQIDGASAGGPAQSFVNQAGANVFSLSGARWIVYLADATSPGNLGLGGLSYSFVRYSATNGPSDWANDVGNGIVSAALEYANLAGTVAPRAYDGTTTATVQNLKLTLSVPGDYAAAPANYSASFLDKNAGTAKPVVFALQSPLSASDATGHPVYGYIVQSATVGNITPALLSGTVTAANKVYDATTQAALTVGAITGFVGTETVGVAGIGNFSDKNVGNGKTVSASYQLSDGLNGGLASNYQFAASNSPITANISPATIGLRATAANKTYDGSTTATISASAITALGNDQVTLNAGTASFSDKNVGTNKPVSLSGFTLSGADAGNYLLLLPSTLTASITPALISFTATVQNKVYDGGVSATISAGSVTPIGKDQLTLQNGSAAFVDRNTGNNKAVLLSGYSLSGADAGNYQLVLPTLTASITPATLTYMADPTAVQVGAPFPVFGGRVNGFVAGDTQAAVTTGVLVFTPGVASSAVGGLYALTGSGLSATNYQFVQAPGNATALGIVDPGSAVAQAQAAVQATNGMQSQPDFSPDFSPNSIPGAIPGASSGPGRSVVLTDGTGHAASAGLLDLTPPPLAPQSGAAPNFDSLPLASLTPQFVADTLGARVTFMNQVLGNGLAQLEADPAAADVPPCKSLKEASAGLCLVTEALKIEARRQLAQQAAAPAPAPAPGAAPATAPGAAPTPAPAPVLAATPLPEPAPAPLFSSRKVKSAALPEIRRKIAVLIGQSAYTDKSIPALANAGSDAHAVAQTLSSQLGYETVVLDNPSKEQMIATLNRLALEAGEQDSVIIYYAGHGAQVDATGQGYWLPASADANQAKTWISNADIGRLVQQVGARQVALISDSCYSGALVSGPKIRGASGAVNPAELLSRRAAVVMSSGGNEPVFDAGRGGHSLFAWSLMRNLEQVTAWQLGGNLFERIRFSVARELPQRPQYGAAQGSFEGGDYFFEFRQLDLL
ncbi:MAG: filamentous hemagglutinin N-terminal domain-containing protein [Paucibacter sp.]|nr:filamentous hemagglutinin N-terminal domain-containing protein [Roseateles sp.]